MNTANNERVVVIGVSAGGFQALHVILPQLPARFKPAVLVVQHRSADGGDFLIQSLAQVCTLPVKDALDKEKIFGGTIYFAPADYHLLVEDDFTISLSVDSPENFARPSIDVLFETAADSYGSGVIGVILTGANSDGSRGLKKIKANSGITIVQDPATAEAKAMPLAAIAGQQPDYILPLDQIAKHLVLLAEDHS